VLLKRRSSASTRISAGASCTASHGLDGNGDDTNSLKAAFFALGLEVVGTAGDGAVDATKIYVALYEVGRGARSVTSECPTLSTLPRS
jgi:hypothetical protein